MTATQWYATITAVLVVAGFLVWVWEEYSLDCSHSEEDDIWRREHGLPPRGT
jgi:hypothetical protein